MTCGASRLFFSNVAIMWQDFIKRDNALLFWKIKQSFCCEGGDDLWGEQAILFKCCNEVASKTKRDTPALSKNLRFPALFLKGW